ncbi:MAG TPA: glycosyltransferase [Pirellulales bacterium]
MYAIWLKAWLLASVLASAQFILLTWSCRENFRFARARLRKSWPREREPRVALFAPCKGLETGLPENLRPLFEQDYANYSLTFIVESETDPAYATLRELIAANGNVPARICVAGISTDTGQKVHNLLAATAQLAADVEVLAFVDSDARPRGDWLRRLVSRLNQPNVGAVTGYRWFHPRRATAAGAFVYTINAAVAGSFGPGGHHLIWGGSWAIRRQLFDSLELRDAWRQTLSDDLVASSVVRRAGLRIEFEPVSMVGSPLDGGWRQSLEFSRRQYLIARCYLPAWWLLALFGATWPVFIFWGGLATLAVGLGRHDAAVWLPAAICPAYYVATLLRGCQRWQLGRLYVPQQSPVMKRLAWLGIWLEPLVALGNWAIIVSSLFGKTLHWRGIQYRLGRRGRVLAIVRPAQSEASSKPDSDGQARIAQAA